MMTAKRKEARCIGFLRSLTCGTLPFGLLLSACTGSISGPSPGTGPTGSGGTMGSGNASGAGGTTGAGNASGSGMPGTGASAGIGGAGNATVSTGGAGGGATTMPPLDCSAPNLQESPLRRLTRREYNNTIRDLLKDTSRPADQFVPESLQAGFTNGAASTLISAVVIDDFERAATVLAKAATSSANLTTFIGCDPNATAGQDTCAATFIRSFGARAFRRTLDAAQVTDYQALYTSMKPDGFPVAIELIVRAMLQSPYFLYHLELGVADSSNVRVLKLTQEEVASRLSYLFLGSTPDATLAQAAKDGKLGTTAEVRAQANRLMLAESGDVFSDFHLQWGGLEKLPAATKPAPFSPDIGRLLLGETSQFVNQILRSGDGTLGTLFTTPVTYLNQQLAAYYGATGVTGTAFTRVTLPAGQRAGLLTQGSFMANFAHGTQSSPVLRGKFILDQLLCVIIPPPPDNANTNLPAPDPAKTARQQLTEVTSVQPCHACHSRMNPPGFAFDHFDGLGRYRTQDRGFDIDSSGELVPVGDLQGSYKDHDEFTRLLANSETVRSCLAAKWFTYTNGRPPGQLDACSLAKATDSFRASSGNVRELLLSITETPSFLYRTKP